MEIRAIEQNSPHYPAEWKDLSDKPQTLYAAGNIELLQTRKLTVVGSRRTPKSALVLGEGIAKELAREFTIVSGAADGGDSAAISGALISGNVICVLAGGFSSLPQSNLSLLEKVMNKGLILSPHPYDTPVRNFSYSYRNKLLAALGEGALVVSAGEKSGALITASYAEKFGKKTFAFPYAVGVFSGEGCNALIKNGAKLTESAGDILKEFSISEREVEKPRPTLLGDEEKVFNLLKEFSELHISELSEKSGVAIFKLSAILSSLEIKGLIAKSGGNRYALV